MKGYFALLSGALVVAICFFFVSFRNAGSGQSISYNTHIRPILSDRCFICHGPDTAKIEASLRLDTELGAKQTPLENGGFAFVAGNPDKSVAYQRMVSDDHDFHMPPAESNLSISPEEIIMIRQWIEDGAEYQPHWAFIPPQKNPLPQSPFPGWNQHPIDQWIGQKMARMDLQPAPPATKEILARRAAFDLTGLPLSPEATNIFLTDTAPSAYENLLDSLLASPAYGERMAAYWLELARYADSDGYLDDKHREFSPWRDWVIEAFNNNMPYDQFISWQIAGDRFPNPSRNQVLASAFNRLHKKNSEAGIVFEEFRAEYVADRTNTFGKAFLGLTLECARCHDHKYDPISQKEYYQLYGFFNQTHELGTAVYGPGQTPGPSLLLTDEETQSQIDFLRSKIAETEAVEKNQQISPKGLFTESEIKKSLKQAIAAHYPFNQFTYNGQMAYSPNLNNTKKRSSISGPDIRKGYSGKAVFVNEYQTIKLDEREGWFDYTQPFSISLAIFPDTVYDEAGLFYHCEDLRLGLKGYSAWLENNKVRFVLARSWPHQAVEVISRNPLPVRSWSHLTFTWDGSVVRMYFDGAEIETETRANHLEKSILFTPDIHTYGFNGFYFGHRQHVRLFRNGGIDEVKIFNRNLSTAEVLYNYQPEAVLKILQQPTSPAFESLKNDFFHFNPADDSIQQKLRFWRDSLAKVITPVPEIMVMGDLPEDNYRKTFILDRGNYHSPGEEVLPATPAVLGSFNGKTREDLAKWLTEPKHPLTARVFVNRIWQMHFGRGLVNTSDDFGAQGSLPAHPELLDWLAVWFVESGWDVKALHKLILTSATFRQSSFADDLKRETDPQNIYLSRGPSFRLPAEMVRDQVLEASGLLVHKTGGPSVYPYQPEGLWESLSNKSWRYKYKQEPGEGLYRRSIYTIWKRTSSPPALLIFDAGDRSVCTVKRQETSTPLQALVLLNDPQFVEAARMMAQQTLNLPGLTADNQLALTFIKLTGRQPLEEEENLLKKMWEMEFRWFSQNPDDALVYICTGETEPDPLLDPVILATHAAVAHNIMNTTDSYTLR
ncbi:MAG: DUF1553 domain-containing protein [Bacteroidia bacterium]